MEECLSRVTSQSARKVLITCAVYASMCEMASRFVSQVFCPFTENWGRLLTCVAGYDLEHFIPQSRIFTE